MAIDKTAADAYFGPTSHVKTGVWMEFSENLRAAAIAQATRQLTTLLGEAPEIPVDTDDPHEDWAVYEQALWILVNSRAVPNGDENGVKFTDELRGDPEQLSPAARRFLGGRSYIELARG